MECRLQDYLASDQFEVLKQGVNKHGFEYKIVRFRNADLLQEEDLKDIRLVRMQIKPIFDQTWSNELKPKLAKSREIYEFIYTFPPYKGGQDDAYLPQVFVELERIAWSFKDIISNCPSR